MSNPYRAAGTYNGAAYIERDADRELRAEISRNQRYPYILASRQSGKSSLVAHTMSQLREAGLACYYIDFSRFLNLSDYNAFLLEFCCQIEPEITFDEMLPRWLLELVAFHEGNRVVLFLDEVDVLRSAKFCDTFFSTIRGVFNDSGSFKPHLRSVQFVLAGAAEADELIKDKNRSPFNVGSPIRMSDLSLAQVEEMARPLGRQKGASSDEIARALYAATSGTIYLTQKILEMLWENDSFSPADIEAAVEAIVQAAPDEIHFTNLYQQITDDQRPSRMAIDIIGLHGSKNIIYERVFGRGGVFTKAFESTASQLAERFPAQEDLLEAAPPADAARVAPAHNLPFRPLPSEVFRGRDTALAELTTDGTQVIGQADAVHGLGGIGKTRFAVEYAWRSAERYRLRLFVRAESLADLRSGLAALADDPLALGLATTDEDARFDAVLGELQHGGWLLILDNVDSEEAAQAVEAILPRLSAGHVLITSRRDDWAGLRTVALEYLPEAEAVAFLVARTERRRVVDGEEAAAKEIAGVLDGLPLALEQAAAYVEKKRLSLASYLDHWRRRRAEVLAFHSERAMKYPVPLAVTWETSLAELGLGARAVLRLASFLAPEPIPERVFLEGKAEIEAALGMLASELGEEAPEGLDVGEALAEIDMLSMGELGEAGLGVHRLVQEVVRGRVPGEKRREWVEKAVRMVEAAIGGNDPMDVRTWPVWEPLRSHVGGVARRADREGIATPTARLMDRLATLLYAKGVYAEAEPLFRRAVEIAEAGLEETVLAVYLNNLAQLLQATNRVAEAEPLMRRALEIDEKSHGADHPNVAIRLNNLAGLLQATNRFAEAEPLMRRALDVHETSYGREHPHVAIGLNNLAQVLQATNRLAEAEPLMRRALEIDEANYGPEHPNVAIDLNNLAQLLQDTNRLAEAEPLMRRALEIDETSYGPEHPHVARDLNNLAQLLQDTNRLAEAEPLYRRGLEIDEESYGPEHPDVAIDLNNLALLLQDTNRLAEAEPLYRRALKIDETTYGPEHPDVAIRLNNLARLFQDTNRLAEAEPLMRRAVEIAEASLGDEHPSTKTFRTNLARLLEAVETPR